MMALLLSGFALDLRLEREVATALVGLDGVLPCDLSLRLLLRRPDLFDRDKLFLRDSGDVVLVDPKDGVARSKAFVAVFTHGCFVLQRLLLVEVAFEDDRVRLVGESEHWPPAAFVGSVLGVGQRDRDDGRDFVEVE
jgi:hypothetical protein